MPKFNEPVSFSSLSTPCTHATTGPVYSTSVGVLKARYMQREGDDSVSQQKHYHHLYGWLQEVNIVSSDKKVRFTLWCMLMSSCMLYYLCHSWGHGWAVFCKYLANYSAKMYADCLFTFSNSASKWSSRWRHAAPVGLYTTVCLAAVADIALRTFACWELP